MKKVKRLHYKEEADGSAIKVIKCLHIQLVISFVNIFVIYAYFHQAFRKTTLQCTGKMEKKTYQGNYCEQPIKDCHIFQHGIWYVIIFFVQGLYCIGRMLNCLH